MIKLSSYTYNPSRVRPEGGFKNRNRKPDLPKHNSGSYYRNRNIFIVLPVPVNPEPEFKIFVPVPAKPEPEIGFNRISGRIYQNSFSQQFILFKKCLLRLDMHFKHKCYILTNIFTNIFTFSATSHTLDTEIIHLAISHLVTQYLTSHTIGTQR